MRGAVLNAKFTVQFECFYKTCQIYSTQFMESANLLLILTMSTYSYWIPSIPELVHLLTSFHCSMWVSVRLGHQAHWTLLPWVLPLFVQVRHDSLMCLLQLEYKKHIEDINTLLFTTICMVINRSCQVLTSLLGDKI